MKTRYVLLVASLLGAGGALFLASDMYWRVREAERSASSTLSPEMLRAGMVHVLGLLSLSFLFLALFLLVIAALKDPVFAARIEGEPDPAPKPVSALLPTYTTEVAPPVAVPIIPSESATPSPVSSAPAIPPETPNSEPALNDTITVDSPTPPPSQSGEAFQA